MSLNPFLMDPSGEPARAAFEARLQAAALERLARAARPTRREQIAAMLVALATRVAPSLRISVVNPVRPAASVS